MLKQQLEEAMKHVRGGATAMARTQAAQHLAGLTKGINALDVDDQDLWQLTSLMDSPEDSVRYWVARCLGNLGYRAMAAVPKLQAALAQVDHIPGSKTSASGIRLALTQITGTAPAPITQ